MPPIPQNRPFWSLATDTRHTSSTHLDSLTSIPCTASTLPAIPSTTVRSPAARLTAAPWATPTPARWTLTRRPPTCPTSTAVTAAAAAAVWRTAEQSTQVCEKGKLSQKCFRKILVWRCAKAQLRTRRAFFPAGRKDVTPKLNTVKKKQVIVLCKIGMVY